MVIADWYRLSLNSSLKRTTSAKTVLTRYQKKRYLEWFGAHLYLIILHCIKQVNDPKLLQENYDDKSTNKND